ncbi:N-acetylmuramoyl-L-alanine amidase [Alicyclobacillus pomorum]|uniref:N-acetylmuramoyl-L-alanine amidase n=1 Tax=Alicyclobacillus pomorum TaxID=204470 RepID=UPI000402B542|nr:N-acetylmuramoyl-L-alanine amidase [Alicyclobacillus pomorum]
MFARTSLAAVAAFILLFVFVPTSAQADEFGLAHKTIVIDAGHGGPDGGAETADGRPEKVVTLAIAKKLQVLLQQAGATVYMTRRSDDDLASDLDQAMGRRHQSDLRNRTRFAKSKAPDAFVSVHCNASPSPLWRGAHTIFMKDNPDGEQLAKMMQIRFKELLLPTKREADDMDTLYLLRRIPGPTVLAEVGFLSNPEEASALHTEKYQQRIAFAIYLSLLDYFQQATAPPDEDAS